jgi:hypothetical protein
MPKVLHKNLKAESKLLDFLTRLARYGNLQIATHPHINA